MPSTPKTAEPIYVELNLAEPLWRPVHMADYKISDRVSLTAVVDGEDINFITWSVYRQADYQRLQIGGGMANSVEEAKIAAAHAVDVWKRTAEECPS
jgi:hypothetical protein